MNIDDIINEWKTDSKIDDSHLAHAALYSSILHSKYLELLSKTKIKMQKLRIRLSRLHNIKTRYYRGELTKEELQEYGWSQYQGNKPLKSEMERLLDTDPDCIEILESIDYLNTCKETLESIIRQIGSRSYDIKNYIEWNKFQAGC